MKGGRLIGGPWFKQLLSRLSGLTLCWFRGIPTHDATNAFKIYDRAMLGDIHIESKGGFELSLEITVKAFLAGYTISENARHLEGSDRREPHASSSGSGCRTTSSGISWPFPAQIGDARGYQGVTVHLKPCCDAQTREPHPGSGLE